MMLLPALILALISGQEATSLPALAEAVAQCDRDVTTPAFRGEEERRSRVMVSLFAEQQAIAEARVALAARRTALRTAAVAGDSEAQIGADSLALSDRQATLDDSRQLERMRQETMDQLRRHYLAQCNERGRRTRGAEAGE